MCIRDRCTLGACQLGALSPIIINNTLPCFIVGVMGFIGSALMRPITVDKINENTNEYSKTKNPISRLALYSLGVLGLGFTISPMVSFFGPLFLTYSYGVTLGVYGGACAFYAAFPKYTPLGPIAISSGSLIGLSAV